MLQQAFVQNEIEKNKILEDLNGIHDFLKIGDKNYLEPTSFVFSSETVALKRTITLIQLKTPHESIRAKCERAAVTHKFTGQAKHDTS